VLAPVYRLFTDWADMADVQDARAVLAAWTGSRRPAHCRRVLIGSRGRGGCLG